MLKAKVDAEARVNIQLQHPRTRRRLVTRLRQGCAAAGLGACKERDSNGLDDAHNSANTVLGSWKSAALKPLSKR